MCDTFVALSDATLGREVIFGKNSDRPKGEIQDIVVFPAQNYSSRAVVQCSYLQIPQAKQTFAVVLSKPRWMWGAEMGANEQGVVIGNEAVWTTQPYSDTGLLGMDLVRLGLERGATAAKAFGVIVELLEKYGQGGNCAEYFVFNYHNSFLIADKNEAWVLETAGNYWVTERITSGTRSISNNLSINGEGDFRHAELNSIILEEGHVSNRPVFDFAQHFSVGTNEDPPFPDCREGRVRQLCQLNENKFTLETAKSILRDHQGNICWHDKFETRGSQVSSLSHENCKHWFIEGPFPCQQKYQLKTFSM